MIKERLIGYIEQSIRHNWEKEALSNYKEKGFSYKEIAEKILKLHIFFKDAGLREGDKIALVGRNSASWCVVYHLLYPRILCVHLFNLFLITARKIQNISNKKFSSRYKLKIDEFYMNLAEFL